MKTLFRSLPILAIFAFIPTNAHALTVSGFAGKYFGTNESVSWAGELTFNLIPMIDLGGFFEHSGESPSTHGPGDESRSFYGGVARFTLPVFPFFADLRIGPHSIGFTDGASMNGFTTQLGFGYAFGIAPGFAFVPRVGVQLADTNSTYPDWNGSLGLSLTIL